MPGHWSSALSLISPPLQLHRTTSGGKPVSKQFTASKAEFLCNPLPPPARPAIHPLSIRSHKPHLLFPEYTYIYNTKTSVFDSPSVLCPPSSSPPLSLSNRGCVVHVCFSVNSQTKLTPQLQPTTGMQLFTKQFVYVVVLGVIQVRLL